MATMRDIPGTPDWIAAGAKVATPNAKPVETESEKKIEESPKTE